MEGIERVDGTMWKNFIRHISVEDKLFEMDFMIDIILSSELNPVVLNFDNTSSDLSLVE